MNEAKHENDRNGVNGAGTRDPYEKLAELGDLFDAQVRYDRNAASPGLDMKMAWTRWQSMAIKMGRLGLVLRHMMAHHDLRPGSTIATSIVCDSDNLRRYIYTAGDDLQINIARWRTILDDTPAWEAWGRMWSALTAQKNEEKGSSEEDIDLWSEVDNMDIRCNETD